ncbi:hypothetical protein HU718_015540 [Pseudomonas tensinigenes]|uniref:Lipoprotein n=1 Tax=Pseudomonas tensinigenes TaxID=2745511 RepID=A0ABX8PQ81_9PSED|nr:hypothetical protein [Pseudomonas tensinigenes]QXI03458.1 hypothetical protein HU718_015540 [Pseudomonas tensinigenes]
MRNQLLIVISLLALGGCQSIKILTTSTLEPATGDGEKTQVIPIAKSTFEGTGSQWEQLFGATNQGQWAKRCNVLLDAQTEEVPQLAAAALTAAGGVVWNLAVDAANSKIDEIQERSVKSWTATWSGNKNSIQRAQCFAVVRLSGDKVPQTQMAILFHTKVAITGKPEAPALQWAPLLVGSRTSLALTRKEGTEGTIGLSLSVAAKSFKDGEFTVRATDPVSVSGITVSSPGENVPLNSKLVGDDQYSDPLQFFSKDDNSSIYLKFAVVESGSMAGLNTKAKSELKAWTDAMGPVALDAWKKKLDKEAGN